MAKTQVDTLYRTLAHNLQVEANLKNNEAARKYKPTAKRYSRMRVLKDSKGHKQALTLFKEYCSGENSDDMSDFLSFWQRLDRLLAKYSKGDEGGDMEEDKEYGKNSDSDKDKKPDQDKF